MRYWEIDFARGTAVILMLIFHIFFDAYYFGKISLNGAFWYYFPRFIGGMFIFISGFTTSVVYSKRKRRILRKVLKLAALAAMITAATYIFDPQEVVVFGILHFFTLATLASIAFIGKPILCLILGTILFVLGIHIQQITVSTPLFIWLGLIPENFTTLDYYPFLPWFGVFLLGMFAGNYYKPVRNIQFAGRELVTFLGRHSLKIYIIQHPIIVLVLHLFYGDILQQLIVLR